MAVENKGRQWKRAKETTMNNARQAVGIPTISPIEAVAEMACDDGKRASAFRRNS